jgi:hypothetical protein
VDIREAPAVDTDRGDDPLDLVVETVERDVERLGGGRAAGRRCGVSDGAVGSDGLVVEDEVGVGSDPATAVDQDRGRVEVVVTGAPADGDGERGIVEGDVLACA